MVYRRLGWARCDGVSPTYIVEVACGGLLVGLHFGGRRSGLCRGSEEGDLYWFVGLAIWCVWWVLIVESMGMVGMEGDLCWFAMGLSVGGAGA
nr:hypothetical protein CFP56_38219 [Quercus suber]